MIFHVEDWTTLVGQHIHIRSKGRDIRCGEVEAVSLNGDILWLRNEGIEPRALFQKCDGYTAWIASEAVSSDAPIDHFALDADRQIHRLARLIYTPPSRDHSTSEEWRQGGSSVEARS